MASKWERDGVNYRSNIGFDYSGTITATGPRDLVEQWAENYSRSYPPMGYGTHIRDRKEHDDGMYSITIWRSHTCD